MKPGDRLICILLNKARENDTFKQWPLHVTIVAWFRSEVSSLQLKQRLEIELNVISPFIIKGTKLAQFGYKETKKVTLIEPTEPLKELEVRTRKLVKEVSNFLVEQSTTTQRSFKPHVTAQGSQEFRQGQTKRVDSLYIVEQMGEFKQAVQKVNLIP